MCTEHIIDTMTKHMLKTQKIKNSLWIKAFGNVIYIFNKYFIEVSHYQKSLETWNKKMPCIANMCVFRIIAYAMVSYKL